MGEIYFIGALITIGAMIRDGSFDNKGFKNAVLIICAIAVWPILWGDEIYEIINKIKSL